MDTRHPLHPWRLRGETRGANRLGCFVQGCRATCDRFRSRRRYRWRGRCEPNLDTSGRIDVLVRASYDDDGMRWLNYGGHDGLASVSVSALCKLQRVVPTPRKLPSVEATRRHFPRQSRGLCPWCRARYASNLRDRFCPLQADRLGEAHFIKNLRHQRASGLRATRRAKSIGQVYVFVNVWYILP